MKNFLILSLLAFGVTACHTYNRAPYAGGLGEYGFTYDLNASPSPFVDTSYRPLTPYDLAAPSIIVVTHQAPPKIIYQTGPEVGVTVPAGTAPLLATVAPRNEMINEASGASRGTANAPAPSAGYGNAPGGVSYGAPTFFSDNSTNVDTNAVTNVGISTNANFALTNINGTNFMVFNGTNLVAVNTNLLFNGTNLAFNGTNFTLNGSNFVFNGTNFTFTGTNFINEAAGSQLTNPTNNPALRLRGPQPTLARTNNTFNATNSVVPPQQRTLLNPRMNQTTTPNQTTTTPQTPAVNQNQNQNQNISPAPPSPSTVNPPNTGNTVTRPPSPPPPPPLVQPR